MNPPWMPLYVGDYLGDTGHLTTAQHGAYLLLMMHYWRKGELPDDDRQLSKITKLPLKTWCEYRPTLQDFFYEGWKHKRIDAELERMLRVSQRRAIAGQKGGIGSALARMKLENASRSGEPRREQLPRRRRASIPARTCGSLRRARAAASRRAWSCVPGRSRPSGWCAARGRLTTASPGCQSRCRRAPRCRPGRRWRCTARTPTSARAASAT